MVSGQKRNDAFIAEVERQGSAFHNDSKGSFVMALLTFNPADVVKQGAAAEEKSFLAT